MDDSSVDRVEESTERFDLIITNPAMRSDASFNEIYVTRRHPLVVFFKRASSLVKDSSCQTVVVHGLGTCVPAAVWLVQDLMTNFAPLIEIQETQTRTVPVMDDGISNNKVTPHRY